MNNLELNIESKWNQVKGQLKQKYAELTDDDLVYVKGKEEELIGKIQEKTGETKEKIAGWIKNITE